jgi:hypothetical protein
MNTKKIIEKFWEMFNLNRSDELDSDDPGRVNPGLIDTTVIGEDLDIEADPCQSIDTLDAQCSRELKKQEEELSVLQERLALLQPVIAWKEETVKEYGSIPPSDEKPMENVERLYKWTLTSIQFAEDRIKTLTQTSSEEEYEDKGNLSWQEGECWLTNAKKLVRSEKTKPNQLISRLKNLQKRRFHVESCCKCNGTGIYGSGPNPCFYCQGTGVVPVKKTNQDGKEYNWTYQVSPFPFTHWAAIRWLLMRELAKKTNNMAWQTLANQAKDLVDNFNVVDRLNTSNSDKAYEVIYDPSAVVWGTIGCGRNMDRAIDRKSRYISMYRPVENIPIEFFYYEDRDEEEEEIHLSMEQIEQSLLIRLYAETRSYRAVGRILGVPKTTIIRKVKKAFQAALE